MSENLRIMIVDDNKRMVNTLVDILTIKGYDTEAAYSGPEALKKIKRGHFDCVLTDMMMPEMNGVELCRAIANIQPDLPVVLMTAYTADHLVEAALQEGVIAVLQKPLDIDPLLCVFSAIPKKHFISIVDDDPLFCKTMGDMLRTYGFAVTQVTDPRNWNDWKENSRPEDRLILLDMKLVGMTGLDILKQIRKKYPDLPVILVTGYGDEMVSEIEEALEISAHTCLYKPLQVEKLILTIKEIKHQELGRILA